MKRIAEPFHQLVWIDHHQAKIYGVTRHDLTELTVIQAPDQGRSHVHHRGGTMGAGHAGLAADFLQNVTEALHGAEEVLIVGPADAKHALKHYISSNVPLLDKRVIGVEPMDKCGAGELQAFANLFFRQADRMRTS
ncbi:MAG TPA: hypothetical protein VN175_00725 [Rhizomicrobium sp.]|nr:hypothetical protein [Rhizomicrobium sp.]